MEGQSSKFSWTRTLMPIRHYTIVLISEMVAYSQKLDPTKISCYNGIAWSHGSYNEFHMTWK